MKQNKELGTSEIRDSAYFQSLPDIVKQSIVASGKKFKNESELKAFAEVLKEEKM